MTQSSALVDENDPEIISHRKEQLAREHITQSKLRSALAGAVQSLLGRDLLPENPYPSLFRSVNDVLSNQLVQSLESRESLLKAYKLQEGALAKHEGVYKVSKLADKKNFYGLKHLLQAIDVDALSRVRSTLGRLSEPVSMTEGDYSLYSTKAMCGPSMLSRFQRKVLDREVPFPARIDLSEHLFVSGPAVEKGLDVAASYIMQELLSAESSAGHVVSGILIPQGAKDGAERMIRWTLNEVKSKGKEFVNDLKTCIINQRSCKADMILKLRIQDVVGATTTYQEQRGGGWHVVSCSRTFGIHWTGEGGTRSLVQVPFETLYNGVFLHAEGVEKYLWSCKQGMEHREKEAAAKQGKKAKASEKSKSKGGAVDYDPWAAPDVMKAVAQPLAVAFASASGQSDFLAAAFRAFLFIVAVGQPPKPEPEDSEIAAALQWLSSPVVFLDCLAKQLESIRAVCNACSQRMIAAGVGPGARDVLPAEDSLGQASDPAFPKAGVEPHMRVALGHIESLRKQMAELSKLFDLGADWIEACPGIEAYLESVSQRTHQFRSPLPWELAGISSWLERVVSGCSLSVCHNYIGIMKLPQHKLLRQGVSEDLQRLESMQGQVGKVINVSREEKRLVAQRKLPKAKVKEGLLAQYSSDAFIDVCFREVIQTVCGEALHPSPLLMSLTGLRSYAIYFQSMKSVIDARFDTLLSQESTPLPDGRGVCSTAANVAVAAESMDQISGTRTALASVNVEALKAFRPFWDIVRNPPPVRRGAFEFDSAAGVKFVSVVPQGKFGCKRSIAVAGHVVERVVVRALPYSRIEVGIDQTCDLFVRHLLKLHDMTDHIVAGLYIGTTSPPHPMAATSVEWGLAGTGDIHWSPAKMRQERERLGSDLRAAVMAGRTVYCLVFVNDPIAASTDDVPHLCLVRKDLQISYIPNDASVFPKRRMYSHDDLENLTMPFLEIGEAMVWMKDSDVSADAVKEAFEKSEDGRPSTIDRLVKLADTAREASDWNQAFSLGTVYACATRDHYGWPLYDWANNSIIKDVEAARLLPFVLSQILRIEADECVAKLSLPNLQAQCISIQEIVNKALYETDELDLFLGGIRRSVHHHMHIAAQTLSALKSLGTGAALTVSEQLLEAHLDIRAVHHTIGTSLLHRLPSIRELAGRSKQRAMFEHAGGK